LNGGYRDGDNVTHRTVKMAWEHRMKVFEQKDYKIISNMKSVKQPVLTELTPPKFRSRKIGFTSQKNYVLKNEEMITWTKSAQNVIWKRAESNFGPYGKQRFVQKE